MKKNVKIAILTLTVFILLAGITATTAADTNSTTQVTTEIPTTTQAAAQVSTITQATTQSQQQSIQQNTTVKEKTVSKAIATNTNTVEKTTQNTNINNKEEVKTTIKDTNSQTTNNNVQVTSNNTSNNNVNTIEKTIQQTSTNDLANNLTNTKTNVKSSSNLKTVSDITVNKDNYNTYFSNTGLTSSVSENQKIILSGSFTSKEFIINKNGITLTSDGTAYLNNSHIYILDTGTNVIVSNLVINTTGYTEAIDNEANNVTITGNTIELNNTDGVTVGILSSGTNANIYSNQVTVYGPSSAIDWGYGERVGIANTIGIFDSGADNATINSNVVFVSKSANGEDNAYGTIDGIEVQQSSNSVVKNNQVTVTGARFIYTINAIKSVYNLTFSDNTVNAYGERYVAGFQIGNMANNITVVHNTITLTCYNTTIYSGVDEPMVYGIITTSMGGSPSSQFNIDNNIMILKSSIVYGMEIYSTSNSNITNNKVTGNGNYTMGMSLTFSKGNTVTGNTFDTTGDSSVTINNIDQRIKPANIGIEVQDGSNNAIISGNTITTTDTNYGTTDCYAVNVNSTNNVVVTNNYLVANNLKGNSAVHNFNSTSVTISDNTPSTKINTKISAVAINNINNNVIVEGNVTTTDNVNVPSGNIVITSNGATVGTGSVSDGKFSITTTINQKGTYNLIVSYAGTDSYNSADVTIPATVSLKSTIITIQAIPNTSINQTILLNSTVKDSNNNIITSGKVDYYINNVYLTSVTISNNVASYTTKIANGGTYTITAKYISADSAYDNSTTSTTVSILKIDLNSLNINVTPGTKTNDTKITVSAKDANGNPVTTGNVTLKINNNIIGTIDLSNPTIVSYLLSPNTYTINANYADLTNVYNTFSNSTSFTINNTDNTLSITVIPGTTTTYSTITVTVKDKTSSTITTGNVTLFSDNTKIGIIDLSKGNTYSYLLTPSGTYTIKASYNDINNVYSNTTGTTSVTINKTNVNSLKITAIPGTTTEDTVFVVAITDTNGKSLTTGYVTVSLMNSTVIGTIDLAKNSNISYLLSSAGTYNITASYKDSSNIYNDISNVTSVTITENNVNMKVTLIPGTTTTNTTFNINITDTNKPITTGTLYFYNNNVLLGNITVNNNTNTFNYIFNNSGTYNVLVKYNSTTYNPTNTTVNFTVTKTNTTTVVNPVIGTINDNIVLQANITDNNQNNITGGNVTFRINGSTLKDSKSNMIYVNVTNGKALLNYTIPGSWAKNNLTIQAIYHPSSIYNPSQNTNTINVTKITPVVTILNGNINAIYNSTTPITVKITDNNGNIVQSGKIAIKLNGKTIGHANVINGIANYNYTTQNSARTYKLSVIYGSSNYKRGETTTNFTVKKQNTTITINPITTTTGSKITITGIIKNNDQNLIDRNTKVAIKIDGKTIGHTTSTNGIINFNYTISTKYKLSTHTITIISGANNFYNGNMTNTTLTINNKKTAVMASTKLKTVSGITVSEDTFSAYFSNTGLTNKISENQTIILSGSFTSKEFIINKKGITLTSDGTAYLNNSHIYILDTGNNAVVSNLLINTTGYTEAINNEGDNVTITDNTIELTNDNGVTVGVLSSGLSGKIYSNNVTVYGPSSAINWGMGERVGIANTLGIFDYGADNTTIENNTVFVSKSANGEDDAFGTIDGIEVQQAANSIVQNNKVTVTGARFVYAINVLNKVTNITFSDNTITAYGERYVTGFQLGNIADNITVFHNYINLTCYNTTIFYNDNEPMVYGVITTSMGGGASSQFNIINNTMLLKSSIVYGMEIYSTSNSTLIGNKVTGIGNYSMGMSITFSENNTVIGNTFNTTGDSSVKINDIAQRIRPANIGIEIQDSSINAQILNNTVTTIDVNPNTTVCYAVNVNSTNDTIITGNSLVANNLNGNNAVHAFNSTSVIIANNTSPYDFENAIININTASKIISGTNTTFNVTVRDSESQKLLNGSVVFKINGKTLVDKNGKALKVKVINGIGQLTYNLNGYSARNYTLTVVFGKTGYNRAENSTKITINKGSVILTPFTITNYPGATSLISTTIKDTFGNLVRGTTKINLKINGKSLTTLTAVNGIIKQNITLPNYLSSKNYNLTMKVGENNRYRGETVNSILKVLKQNATATIKNATAKPGETVTLKATILNSKTKLPAISGNCVFKINGKTVKDDNGNVIKVDVKNGTVNCDYTVDNSANDGKYNVTIVYSGNGQTNSIRYTTGALTVKA